MRRSSLRSQPGREKVEFFSLLLREVSKLKSTILSLAFVYYIYIIDTHTYIYIYIYISILRAFSLIFMTRRSLILLLQFVIRFYVRYILFALSPASNLYPTSFKISFFSITPFLQVLLLSNRTDIINLQNHSRALCGQAQSRSRY